MQRFGKLYIIEQRKYCIFTPILTYKCLNFDSFWCTVSANWNHGLFVNLDSKQETVFIFPLLWTYLLRDEKPSFQGIVQSLAEGVIAAVAAELDMTIIVILSVKDLWSVYGVQTAVSLPVTCTWPHFTCQCKTGGERLATIHKVSAGPVPSSLFYIHTSGF